jgi:hypothetical protein
LFYFYAAFSPHPPQLVIIIVLVDAFKNHFTGVHDCMCPRFQSIVWQSLPRCMGASNTVVKVETESKARCLFFWRYYLS